MAASWPAQYQDHIRRHHFVILDGRVTIPTGARAVGVGEYSDVYPGTLQSRSNSERLTVAVKMVRGRSIEDSKLKKFLKEVHTWSKLENEYILPLLGITVHLGGTLSIISPWMRNGSARKFLSDGREDPRPLLHDVAAGLHYLHSKGVYHGDLKGDNIMVSNNKRALLADFGFSYLVSSSFSLPISTPTGGGPLWMAPQKLYGAGDSAESDVYSFAMVTLELFTRQNPFHGETFLTLEDIRDGKRPSIPTPAQTLNRMTEDWWKLCHFCWSGDPAKRWTVNQILRFISLLRSRSNHRS
ncbi:kinase-like domain-containing protein [Mycena filopes]|nr:kinase-like domain-containing protein [Mycena filopes]